MDIKKHCFMTFAALFFLGLVVARPGEKFSQVKMENDCMLEKEKSDCVNKFPKNKVNYHAVQYEY